MFCFQSTELKKKSLLTWPSNVLLLHLKPTFTPIFESSLKLKVMGLNQSYLLKSFVLQKRPIKLPSDEIRSKLIFVHSTAFAPIFTISCWFPHTSLAMKRFEDCAILHMKIVSSYRLLSVLHNWFNLVTCGGAEHAPYN